MAKLALATDLPDDELVNEVSRTILEAARPYIERGGVHETAVMWALLRDGLDAAKELIGDEARRELVEFLLTEEDEDPSQN